MVDSLQALAQLLGDTRLADAALAAQQHGLAFAAERLFPAAIEQRHLLLAADEPAEAGNVCRLKAGGGNLARHLPDTRRVGNALERRSPRST